MPNKIKPADRKRIMADLDLFDENGDGRGLTFHGDGTISYRRTYFYNSQIPGGDLNGFEGLLRDRAMKAGHTIETVSRRDVFQRWPRLSFVQIRFRVNLDALTREAEAEIAWEAAVS